MAGLVPWGDYVLAWSGGPLHSESDFYRLIEAHVDKPLRLFVYNSDLESVPRLGTRGRDTLTPQ